MLLASPKNYAKSIYFYNDLNLYKVKNGLTYFNKQMFLVMGEPFLRDARVLVSNTGHVSLSLYLSL